MKVEEVIEAVKETIKHQELVQKTFGYRKEEDRALTGNKIIIKALEKQIPKKPTSEVEWDKFRDCERITRCGECSYEVGRWAKYCPDCGQKVERGESEC